MLVNYQFILPFYVRLPDGAAIHYPYEGRMVSVRTQKIEGERIDSYERGSFEWLTDGEEEGTWYAVATLKNGDSIPFREVLVLDEPELPARGLRDQSVFTLMEIVFELDAEDTDAAASDEIQDWVQQVLGRFIDWYRFVSDEVTAHREEVATSAVVKIYTSTDYKFGPDGFEALFGLTSRILNWDPPQTLGIAKDVLSEGRIEALADSLAADSELDLHLSLLLDAKEMSFSHERHNFAIVLIETAFEVFLQTRLAADCKKRRIAELEIRETARPVSDALADGSVRVDLLGNFPQQICGVNLRTGSSYNGWLTDTYQPRNGIVHGGERGYGAKEAEAAFQAAHDFSKEIDQMLKTA